MWEGSNGLRLVNKMQTRCAWGPTMCATLINPSPLEANKAESSSDFDIYDRRSRRGSDKSVLCIWALGVAAGGDRAADRWAPGCGGLLGGAAPSLKSENTVRKRPGRGGGPGNQPLFSTHAHGCRGRQSCSLGAHAPPTLRHCLCHCATRPIIAAARHAQ